MNTVFSNTTSLMDTLIAATKPLPYDIYANTDLSNLNFFEQAWVDWYRYWGNPVLATGVMSFVMHEVVYFGRCLPWMIIDQMPYFNQWKLQADKVPTAKQQWDCVKYVLYTHFTVELPQIYLFQPIAVAVGMKTWEVPFPELKEMALHLAFFFVFEDAWHYVAHRIMHHRLLYKHIHKIHHKHSAPFGLAAEYAHPIEVIVLGMGTLGGPLLWSYVTGGWLHLITVYVWIIFRLFQAIDSHSGYDFPWSLNKFIPFWAGADHHDFHHQAFTNCYSTSFRYLDHFLGTDDKYRAFRAQQAAAKKAGIVLKKEFKDE